MLFSGNFLKPKIAVQLLNLQQTSVSIPLQLFVSWMWNFFSFSRCGKRTSTENTVNLCVLLYRHQVFICTHNMQKNILQLWHWQPHKFQRGSCSESLCREVVECMKWVFSPFFSSLPEKTEAKIRILQLFMHIPNHPLKLMGDVWVTPWLERNKECF